MQRYAAYRSRVFDHLSMATGIDVRRLPPAALAALPDLYRAGLGIDDAADYVLAGHALASPGPAPEPFPRRHLDDSTEPQSLIPNPQEEK